jgi:hypothetical protein
LLCVPPEDAPPSSALELASPVPSPVPLSPRPTSSSSEHAASATGAIANVTSHLFMCFASEALVESPTERPRFPICFQVPCRQNGVHGARWRLSRPRGGGPPGLAVALDVRLADGPELVASRPRKLELAVAHAPDPAVLRTVVAHLGNDRTVHPDLEPVG